MTPQFARYALAAGLVLLPGFATAQEQYIVGVVVDDDSSDPLEGVHLVLSDSADETRAETLSDSTGAFTLNVPGPGRWTVSADVLGHAPVRSDPLDLGIGERIALEVRMAVSAVPLEPIVVTGRSNMSPDIREFYERRQRGQHSGFGQYVTAADIERRAPMEPTDLFYTMAGVRVAPGAAGYGRILRMSGGCVPAVFIDGMQINRFRAAESIDDYVAVFAIEGIEVYRNPGYQVGRFFDPGGCGLVLIWTQRGEHDPNAHFSWTKLLVGVGLVGAILLIF